MVRTNQTRLIFYTCWIVLGLIQSYFTELQDDEAYYWVWSKFPDWGYFDHPPMTGILIKLGYSVFPNELGVRLLPLLLNTLSILLIEKMLRNRNVFLFYAIVLSIAVLQLSGFVAVPDTPLIFFTALFFFLFDRWLVSNSLINSLLLALAIALLFYSKYHAVLIVVFAFLSNLKLFTKWQTYLVGLIALLFFTPHLYWQYTHDWVSFRYHLFESNVNDYRISYTLEYIAGQIFLPGPIAGFILLPAAFLYKTKDQTERALKWVMCGVYLFFLLSSFRGKVEANWTSPVMVPLIILSHAFLVERTTWRKWLIWLLPATMILILFARIVMIRDILPIDAIKERYHGWKEWPATIAERAGGDRIVFNNSYQRASKFWFYSGVPTYSLNYYRERKNNYNYWPIEDSMNGKPVLNLDIYGLHRFTDSMQTPVFKVGYRKDDSFYSFAKVNFKAEKNQYRIQKEKPLVMNVGVSIPSHYREFAENVKNDTLLIGLFNKKGWINDIVLPYRLSDIMDSPILQISHNTGLTPGKYFIRFAIKVADYPATHNSDKIKLVVE